MGAGVHRSDAYAARKVSGGKDKRVGVVEIDFNLANSEGVNIYSRRDGDADFKFLARSSCLSTLNSQPSTMHKLRNHKAIFVVADKEVSQFSDEIIVNCGSLL
jgi:hypothetical protein